MANIKISELTALTPPDAADLVPVTDSSASQTKRTTVGEIVGIINGDVDVANDGTATISELPVIKLQDGSARQLLQTDAAGTGVEWTSNVDVPGTLDVTSTATFDAALNAAGLASLDGGIDVDGAFTVANTSGNIATTGTLDVSSQSTLASAAVSDLTSGRVVLAGTSGELEDNAGLTFNGTQLDVDGDIDLASAKEYRIAGTKVLDATSLGSGVVSSSLTSVGTIGTGAWEATAIGVAYGGTGQTTYTDGQLLIGNSTGNTLVKATLTAGTGISVTNGSGTITLAIDSDTAIADITTTATTGTLPTADGSVTIADAAAPTVDELLEYCVELEAKLEAALAALRTVGVIAT